MASVYGKIPTRNGTQTNFDYLPITVTLRNGVEAEIDLYSENDFEKTYEMFQLMLEAGKYWPFNHDFDEQAFRDYFLSDACFVMRAKENKMNIKESQLLAMFYVKPNFPGRCDHICNGGFITAREARGLGVGYAMGRHYLRFAKELGYLGSLFNLVFVNNIASIKIWDRLGFTRNSIIPKAGRLKGCGEEPIDAIQFYYDLSTYDHTQHDVQDDMKKRETSGALSLYAKKAGLVALVAAGVASLACLLSSSKK